MGICGHSISFGRMSLLCTNVDLPALQPASTASTAGAGSPLDQSADGFGPPGEKIETWNALRRDAPEGLVWGWKNFYDEDSPTFTPAQTLDVEPEPPVFISYQ